MSGAAQTGLDELSAASRSVAVVIALNKPVYPLYVWWLAEDAFKASLVTAASLPLYAAVIYLYRKHPYAGRIGMVLAGTLDTLAITKFFGEASGAWLFLAPCLLLAFLSFYEIEKWTARILIGAVFALFAVFFGRYGAPVFSLSASEIDTLYTLNIFGAFSLLAFICLRFPMREAKA